MLVKCHECEDQYVISIGPIRVSWPYCFYTTLNGSGASFCKTLSIVVFHEDSFLGFVEDYVPIWQGCLRRAEAQLRPRAGAWRSALASPRLVVLVLCRCRRRGWCGGGSLGRVLPISFVLATRHHVLVLAPHWPFKPFYPPRFDSDSREWPIYTYTIYKTPWPIVTKR